MKNIDKCFSRIKYSELKSRQQENYNFQKVSAILADYGFITHRLSDDWQGADFIAQHIDGETFIKVQLKSRLTFDKKYRGKDIYVAFYSDDTWYLFPHDKMLEKFIAQTNIVNTGSWKERGNYSFSGLSRLAKKLLVPYQIYPYIGE